MNGERIDTGGQLRDLDFLLEVTRETLSSLQLATLLRRIVRLLHDRFGYDCAAVALVEESWVVFRAGAGGELDALFESGHAPAWRVRLGHGGGGEAVQTKSPRLVADSGEGGVGDAAGDGNGSTPSILAGMRSELTVPLVHADVALGALDVRSQRPQAFSDTDVRLLEIVGALVAPAVHIASLYERERTRARHQHLVSEISRLVMSSLDRETIVTTACEAILEALDISFASIALLGRSGLRIAHGGHATRLSPLSEDELADEFAEGPVARVLQTGQLFRLGSSEEAPELRLMPGMCSALCVPLKMREKVIGAVDIEHSAPNHFTVEDEPLLESIAAYLSQAMENAQLFEDQRRRWQQLLVINETARIATESRELEEILAQVAKEVHDRFGYFAVAVMLCDDRDVVIRALNCDEPLEVGVGFRERIGSGVAGKVAQTGQLVQGNTSTAFDRGSALRADIQSVLCVPLRAHSGVIGVIEVQSLESDAFGSDDRLVMATLAQSVAGAIANARMVRQTEQMREDLNRMVVHDLRNPVQAVLLTLQEVQRAAEGKLPENVVDSVKEGASCSEEILQMVNSLLDVSRFEAGKAQLRFSPAVLNDHIRAVVKRFAPLARQKRIQITTILSQDVPVLRLDHELTSRMLGNLVGNAVKFTPEGARVTVRSEVSSEPRSRVSLAAPYVLVSVQDTGEGVPPEFHDKIFEKFGQVESRKAGLKMSTGLGLALCRYVVEAHGGCIWVESTPGKGSTFFIALPPRR